MKHLDEVLCAAVVAAAGCSCAIPYLGGRQRMPLSLGMLPAEVAPFLVSLLCLASLVIILVRALIKRKGAGKAAILLGLALLFFALGSAVSNARMFQAGFRQRIRSTVSPEELRAIARLCQEKLAPGASLPGPGKRSLWNEPEHRPQWNALVKSSSLGKLDPSLTIFNNPNAVEIAWGGALVGHWSVIIQTEGTPEAGDIAEGIRTVISSQ